MIYYSELYNHLTAYIQISQTAIQHIDLHKRQYDNEETETTYPLPAVFIEFIESSPIDYTQKKIISWQEELRLHLEVESIIPTNQSETSTDKLNHLLVFEELEKVMADYNSPCLTQVKSIKRIISKEANKHPVCILQILLPLHSRNC